MKYLELNSVVIPAERIFERMQESKNFSESNEFYIHPMTASHRMNSSISIKYNDLDVQHLRDVGHLAAKNNELVIPAERIFERNRSYDSAKLMQESKNFSESNEFYIHPMTGSHRMSSCNSIKNNNSDVQHLRDVGHLTEKNYKNVIPVERVFERNRSYDSAKLMQDSKIYSKSETHPMTGSHRMSSCNYLLSLATLFCFFAITSLASASQNFITIDTVYQFTPGTGQNIGQGKEYFPNNIFGKPYSKADSVVPAVSPEDLCSLGLNGEIIVGFKNYSIVDGDGVDFIIYENVMKNNITGRLFIEPAKVSVSNDGINWTEFPFDSLTMQGCAGTKPTFGANVDIDILQSGGNGFDLAQIGVYEIKYIKITDVSAIILNNKKHPFYDVTISGFDLEALVGVIYKDNSITSIEENSQKIRNFVNIKEIIANTSGLYEVYSISGERIFFGNGDELNKFDTQLNSGVYIIINRNLNNIDIYKIIK